MYTNFGAELMATAKEYPVKIRKIPVLDKKTGITYFEIRRTRYPEFLISLQESLNSLEGFCLMVARRSLY